MDKEQARREATIRWRERNSDLSLTTRETASYRDGFYDGWQAREAASWIEIKSEDDLPKEDGGYLTTRQNKDGSLSVSELYLVTRDWEEPPTREWEAGGDGWPRFDNVIAWSELPEPFTSKGEQQ